MVADHLHPFILSDLQPITPSKSTLSTRLLKESTKPTIENKSLFPPTTTPTLPMMLLHPMHQAFPLTCLTHTIPFSTKPQDS